jgi:hypothetical protein
VLGDSPDLSPKTEDQCDPLDFAYDAPRVLTHEMMTKGQEQFQKPTPNVRDKFLAAGGGRIDRKEVRRRAAEAMARNLPPLTACINTAREWAIIGGGPSINQNVDDIRRLKRRGVNIVSVNKSHDWLLSHSIVPWGHILLDPMEWVADYVQKPRRDVRYFIASQCHAKTFEALKDYPVFLWHAGQDFPEGSEPNGLLRELWPHQPWFVLPGPTTVGLRAIYVGNAMGADKFHLFGLDSSRSTTGTMHGYAKAEPPDAQPGKLARKHNGQKYWFDTNSHMARQQFDFDRMIEKLPEEVRGGIFKKMPDLTVYGSGLLPFFAAQIQIHADPECNADPTKVGGYIAGDYAVRAA